MHRESGCAWRAFTACHMPTDYRKERGSGKWRERAGVREVGGGKAEKGRGIKVERGRRDREGGKKIRR